MQCYTELVPPTGVTCSLSLPFISENSNNLVVGKGSLLQIFTTKTISAELDSSVNQNTQNGESSKLTAQYDSRLNDDDGLEASFLGGDAVLLRADRSTNTKLVLITEIPLSGIVVGLARIKIANSKSGGEAILIHLRDAKLCLAQWDPERNGLENISIHYYEQDDLPGPPWLGPLSNYENFLAADPGSRCAVLKFGDRNIAIIPFKQSDVDIEMDDWDEDLDGPRPVKQPSASAATNGTSKLDTPYLPSFVLRLPMLDPSLLHPVHFAFLYEYKEPTFGILSSAVAPSHNLGRKDQLSYMVFTLDLQQKASTPILSVGGLPQDLNRVIPLQAPVGGALLVGPDCIIHVGQSGKANGVAVNHFTKELTGYGLADQSALDLRLEQCVIEPLSYDTGELLMVMWDARLAVISFKLDGRTVSGISIKVVSDEFGEVIPSTASCISHIGKNTLFIGSSTSDSTVIGWTRKQAQTSRRKSRLLDASLDFELDDLDLDEEDDDDLYGDDSGTAKTGANSTAKSGELVFRVHDTLFSIAPIRDFTTGKVAVFPESEEQRNSLGVKSELQLACVVGKGNKGGSCVAIMNREIQPKVIGRFEFPEARGFWTTCAQKPMPKSLQGDKGASVGNDYDNTAQHDKFMIVSKVDLDGYETSDVYALTSAGFEDLTGTEFEPAAGFTVEAGTMGKHMRIIQVLKSEVRCYDGGALLAIQYLVKLACLSLLLILYLPRSWPEPDSADAG
jgi:cleavage and polyadenylation specificity factor subunit 1